MRVISYNLRENHASGELVGLVERFDPEVLCLQECGPGLPEHIGALRLAGATLRNRLGLALYYREHRFTMVTTETFALKKSLHDHLLAPADERLLGTRLIDRQEEEREVVVASFHAAPLTAANSLRRTQIQSAHARLRELGPGLPTLMVGDYNYPWFQKSLRARMVESGYELSRSDRTTYARYKYFRGHFDFATSTGLEIGVETLPSGVSDHKPILVSAEYRVDGSSEDGGGEDVAVPRQRIHE